MSRTIVTRAHRLRLQVNDTEAARLEEFARARQKAWNWALATLQDLWGLDRCADRLRATDQPGQPYRRVDKFTLITLFTQNKAGLEGKIKEVTVSRVSGKWYASVLLERQAQRDLLDPAALTPQDSVGLDLGLTTYATFSDGHEIPTRALPPVTSAARNPLGSPLATEARTARASILAEGLQRAPAPPVAPFVHK